MRRNGRFNLALGQARSLLDGAVIAVSLLYPSWALVLGPVFRAGEGSILEQAIALAYPVVVARIRVGGAAALLAVQGPRQGPLRVGPGRCLGHRA